MLMDIWGTRHAHKHAHMLTHTSVRTGGTLVLMELWPLAFGWSKPTLMTFYKVMAYIVVAYIVVAYIVMALGVRLVKANVNHL